jgi:hypothetical protein
MDIGKRYDKLRIRHEKVNRAKAKIVEKNPANAL